MTAYNRFQMTPDIPIYIVERRIEDLFEEIALLTHHYNLKENYGQSIACV